MAYIDVFAHREYLFGNVYSYNNSRVIASIDPNGISFIPDYQKPKSGGCCVRFITDSPEVKINYSITPPLPGNFPHVGISAQRGLSCSYRRLNESYWRNIDCFNSRSESGEALIQSNRCVAEGQLYELSVFLPINCFVTRMEILLNDGAAVRPCGASRHRITVLSGTTGYGLGISSTHFLLSSLLTRHIPDSAVTGISFNSGDVWGCYEAAFPHIDTLGSSEFILMEVPYPIEDTAVNRERVFGVLNSLCGSTDGKVILWYRPCFEQHFSTWATIFESFIANNGLRSKILFDKRFLLKDNTDFDMYMSSGKFVNDTGNIFIMKQIKEMIEDIWNI